MPRSRCQGDSDDGHKQVNAVQRQLENLTRGYWKKHDHLSLSDLEALDMYEEAERRRNMGERDSGDKERARQAAENAKREAEGQALAALGLKQRGKKVMKVSGKAAMMMGEGEDAVDKKDASFTKKKAMRKSVFDRAGGMARRKPGGSPSSLPASPPESPRLADLPSSDADATAAARGSGRRPSLPPKPHESSTRAPRLSARLRTSRGEGGDARNSCGEATDDDGDVGSRESTVFLPLRMVMHPLQTTRRRRRRSPAHALARCSCRFVWMLDSLQTTKRRRSQAREPVQSSCRFAWLLPQPWRSLAPTTTTTTLTPPLPPLS